MNLAKSTKILRSSLKMSQRAFALKVGVFYPLIANLERGIGATNPTLRTLTKIAGAGGLTVAQFLELPNETDAE